MCFFFSHYKTELRAATLRTKSGLTTWESVTTRGIVSVSPDYTDILRQNYLLICFNHFSATFAFNASSVAIIAHCYLFVNPSFAFFHHFCNYLHFVHNSRSKNSQKLPYQALSTCILPCLSTHSVQSDTLIITYKFDIFRHSSDNIWFFSAFFLFYLDNITILC